MFRTLISVFMLSLVLPALVADGADFGVSLARPPTYSIPRQKCPFTWRVPPKDDLAHLGSRNSLSP